MQELARKRNELMKLGKKEGMGFFPMSGEATSDKWGILPILSSYPSLLIGKLTLSKNNFHKIIENFPKLWGKNNSP